MVKKEKIVTTVLLILYAVALLGGYLAGILDWAMIKANYLIAPALAAVTMGLDKKWFSYAMLGSSFLGLVVGVAATLAGAKVPVAIVNMAALAIGVIVGVVLDMKNKNA